MGFGDIVDDVSDTVDKAVDEAEDTVQGATGIDFGGSGGGKNADDVTDTNEDTSQGVTDNPGQAASEAAEGVGQAVDKAEDAVQSSTGVDVGGSGGGSSDTDTQTSESSVDVDLGGGGGGSESDVVDDDDDDGGGSSPTPGSGSSSSSSSANDSAKQLKNQLTQKDKKGFPEEQKKVDRAQRFREKNPLVSQLTPQMGEALKTREQNLETRQQIEDQLDRIQQAPQGARFKFGNTTLTKEQVLDRLQEQKSQVSQTIQKNDRRFEQFENQRAKAMRPDPRPITEGALGRFVNPNKEVDNRKRDPNLNVLGETVVAGQDIIQSSEEFGKDVAEDVPLDKSLGIAGLISGPEQVARGNLKQGAKDFFVPGVQSELEKKRAKDIEQGIFAGPGTLAGFAVGGAGAVSKTLQMELEKLPGTGPTSGQKGPGFGGAITQGAGIIASQASENPGEFAAQEAGEEIGEGIATLGVGLAAPTITPDPTLEVNTPESAQTAGRFVKGDLGVRARDPNTKINLKETEVLERRTEDLEGGGRAQVVRGFDENLEPTGGGVRPETPVSRREFLKEKAGLKEKDFSDRLPDLGKKRKGQLNLGGGTRVRSVPDTTEPEVDPQPDTPGQFDQEDLFKDVRPEETKGPDPLPDSFSVPKSSLTLNTEPGQAQDNRFDQAQKPDLGLFEAQRPEQVQRFEQEVFPETQLELEQQLEQQVQPEQTLTPQPEPLPDPTVTPDFRPDSSESFKKGRRPSSKESDAGNIFAPSLEGVVFGLEAQEQTEQDVFSGLEARGVPDRFL